MNFYLPMEQLIPFAWLIPHGAFPTDHLSKSQEVNTSHNLKAMPNFSPLPVSPLFPMEVNVSQMRNTNLEELSLHYPQLWHDFQKKCQLMLNNMKVTEVMNANKMLPNMVDHKSNSNIHSTDKSSKGKEFLIKSLIENVHTDSPATSPTVSVCVTESSSTIRSNDESLLDLEQCKEFSSLNSLNRFQCRNCQKSYSTRTGLQRHYENHCNSGLESKRFSCEHCAKLYHSLSALKMHIRTHTLPCKCSVCGKAFSRMWLLNGHLRTHSGEKPFCCSICDRAFADRSNLRAHLQTHTDIKKYECNHCKKTFSRMGLLTKHKASNNCKISGGAVTNSSSKDKTSSKIQ